MLTTEFQTGMAGAYEQIEHHAPLMRAFADAFFEECFHTLAADPGEWLVRQSRTGARSWAVIAPDGTEYHLRSDAYDPPQVDVYDAYRNGGLLETLRTPAELRVWMRAITARVAVPA